MLFTANFTASTTTTTTPILIQRLLLSAMSVSKVLSQKHTVETFLGVIESQGWKQFETDEDKLDFVKEVFPEKVRKKRESKHSSDPEERSKEAYDPARCDARVWRWCTPRSLGGIGVQCSCKKVDGRFLCTRHQKDADKHDGVLRNGFFNKERPTHEYGNTEDPKAFLPWSDVDASLRPKTRTKKPRKCGSCGETGHTKAKCPKKSTDDISNAVNVEELREQVAQQVDHPDVAEDTQSNTAPVDNGAGTGLPKEDIPQEQVEEQVEVEQVEVDQVEVEQVDDTNNGDLVSDHEEVEADGDETEPEDNQDDEYITFKYEGITYTRDEDGTVFDLQDREVGIWEDDDLSFTRSGKKHHVLAVSSLK